MKLHNGHTGQVNVHIRRKALQSVLHQHLNHHLHLNDIQTFLTALYPPKCTTYVNRGSYYHILESVKVLCQKTLKLSRSKKKSCLYPAGLLGFEVPLLDLNQHGAGQGLYWLLWPTSVGHGLPLTCLSLTPNNITFCLGHSTTTELLHHSKYNNSSSFLLKRGILCLSSFSASTKDGIKEEDERWA